MKLADKVPSWGGRLMIQADSSRELHRSTKSLPTSDSVRNARASSPTFTNALVPDWCDGVTGPTTTARQQRRLQEPPAISCSPAPGGVLPTSPRCPAQQSLPRAQALPPVPSPRSWRLAAAVPLFSATSLYYIHAPLDSVLD